MDIMRLSNFINLYVANTNRSWVMSIKVGPFIGVDFGSNPNTVTKRVGSEKVSACNSTTQLHERVADTLIQVLMSHMKQEA